MTGIMFDFVLGWALVMVSLLMFAFVNHWWLFLEIPMFSFGMSLITSVIKEVLYE